MLYLSEIVVANAIAAEPDVCPKCGGSVVRTYFNRRYCAAHCPGVWHSPFGRAQLHKARHEIQRNLDNMRTIVRPTVDEIARVLWNAVRDPQIRWGDMDDVSKQPYLSMAQAILASYDVKRRMD